MIRPAQSGDRVFIVPLITQILTQEFPQDQTAYSTEDLEQLDATYAPPWSVFLVAEVAKRIVGTCGVKTEGSHTAVLRRLFVDSKHRGRGIGTRLLQEALRFCRERGLREVVIRTSTKMDKAISLCRSLGFLEEGRWKMGQVTLLRLRLKLKE